MPDSKYIIKEMIPSAKDFNRMRESVGWSRIDEDLVKKGLKNSLYALCVFDSDIIIGICRLVGDGALKIYVEELIIHPDYQKKGLGTELMRKIMDYVHKNYKKGCHVGLFANKGLEKYYNQFGFKKRKEDMPGMDYRC